MLGSNVPTIGGLNVGISYAIDWNCECIQIYLTNSRKWDVDESSYEKAAIFRSNLVGSPIKSVISHVPFLVNLASPDCDIQEKSMTRLVEEVKLADSFNVPFIVLHPGSATGIAKEEGLHRIARCLNTVLKSTFNNSAGIALETMAGQGRALGSKFEEIAYIMKKCKMSDRLGVCFDTAHVFQAGYDIRGYDGWLRVLDIFEEIIGVERIRVIHINDSYTDLSSHVDRHAPVGQGQLGLQIFHAITREANFKNIPKILETPNIEQHGKRSLLLLRKLESSEGPIQETVSASKSKNKINSKQITYDLFER